VGVQPSDEACSGRPARHHFHRTLGVAFRRQWSGLGNLPLSTGRVGHGPTPQPTRPAPDVGRVRAANSHPSPRWPSGSWPPCRLSSWGALAARNGVRLLNVLLS